MSVAEGIHEVNWYRLLVPVLAWPIVIVACLGILLPPAVQIARVTGGLVQPTLLFSIVLLVVVILGAVRWGGNLRAFDIGLTASKIPTGLAVTLGVWVTLQVILLIVALIGRESAISLNPGRWTTTLGLLAAQVLGAAFVEESMFRGFLLPQLYLKLGGQADKTLWRPMLSAILVSQLAFALIHIPNLQRLGVPGGDPVGKLTMIFVLGVFFALLYVRTGNLFISVGLHALINRPTPLVRPVVQPEAVVFFLALLVLVLWPWLSKPRTGEDQVVGSSA